MMNKRDKHFLDIAEKQALTSDGPGGAMLGAVLVHRNRIISFGVNQAKSHPFQARFAHKKECIYLHAETDAIRNALKVISFNELYATRTTLYLVRLKRAWANDTKAPYIHGIAKPCLGCLRAIITHNINRVVYTTDDGVIDEIVF